MSLSPGKLRVRVVKSRTPSNRQAVEKTLINRHGYALKYSRLIYMHSLSRLHTQNFPRNKNRDVNQSYQQSQTRSKRSAQTSQKTEGCITCNPWIRETICLQKLEGRFIVFRVRRILFWLRASVEPQARSCYDANAIRDLDNSQSTRSTYRAIISLHHFNASSPGP